MTDKRYRSKKYSVAVLMNVEKGMGLAFADNIVRYVQTGQIEHAKALLVGVQRYAANKGKGR